MGDHSSENYLDQLLNSMHGEETEHPKEQPMDYLRYSLAQLAENCKRWGLEEEMSKLYI